MGLKKYKKCEICMGRNIDEENYIFARFPTNKERCKKWVQATGKPALASLTITQLHYSHFVCGKHFPVNNFRNKGTRLTATAIPTLYLPSPPLSDKFLENFPPEKLMPPIPVNAIFIHKTVTIGDTNEISRATNHNNVMNEHNYFLPFDKSKCTKMLQDDTELDENKRKYCDEGATIPQTDTETKYGTPICSSLVDIISENESRKKMKICSTPDPTASSVQLDVAHHSSNVKITNPVKKQTTTVVTLRRQKIKEKLKEAKEKIKVMRKKLRAIENIESPLLKSLIESDISNRKKKPHGKRWSTFSKCVALAVYKKSPKAYRYLEKLLPMPSIRTLQTVVQEIQLMPGIDLNVLHHLKEKAPQMSEQDKLCVILFDEMALKKRLIYNIGSDRIDGYEDYGNDERSNKIADHALVFMIQGLHVQYKQPIAHYFVTGTVSSEKLVVLIKNCINAITQTGYNVIATVCDQGPTNVGAINMLKKFSHQPNDSNYYFVGDKKVYILYDVPHLFKSIRNNFHDAGEMVFSGRKAKWAHLVDLCEINTNLSLNFPKITKTHVYLKYGTKMRVKYAAQLLSSAISSILALRASDASPIDTEKAKSLLDTSYVIGQLDKLFDCTNGPNGPKEIKKNIRENVHKNSFHHVMWRQFIKMLGGLNFLKSDSQIRLRNVRCVNGYITTIKSLQDIWGIVSANDFKYLNLRQCNQDALENLFGIIRQHCPTNSHPTIHHFTSALKSSIITRMTSPPGKGSNCELDGNQILFDFHDIVFKKMKESESVNKKSIMVDKLNIDETECNEIPELHILSENLIEKDVTDLEEMFKNFEKQPTVYVSGYLAKILLKENNCVECARALKVDDPPENSIYNYIALREWWDDKNSLTYPTLRLCETVDTATALFEKEVKPYIYRANISKYAVTILMASTSLSWMCHNHYINISEKLLRCLSYLLIRKECRSVNLSLKMKEQSVADLKKKSQQY